MRRRAFTLIEVMLAVSMFATLSLAVFTCLSNGLRLWQRAGQLVSEEDVSVFFDRFSSDLRNTFSHSRIFIDGTESRFAFPTVVWTQADRVGVRADEGFIDQLGRVEYFLDPQRSALVRRQANYSQALGQTWGPEQVVVPRVAGVRFHYFYTSSHDPRLAAEAADGLPAGVEVEVSLPGATPGVEGEKVFKRFISVPSGV